MKRSRDNVFDLERRSPGIAVRHNNLSDMSKVLNRIVYEKGGWTLHMLRGLMGTDKFWAGIREYYRRYRDANASTDDFRGVMEAQAGADLKWFFDQWLNRVGSPVVDWSWRYDAGARKVVIDLAQTQPGEPYRLPVEIEVGDKIEKLEVTQKQQRFEIPEDEMPAAVVLDPHTWTLMYAKFGKQ